MFSSKPYEVNMGFQILKVGVRIKKKKKANMANINIVKYCK